MSYIHGRLHFITFQHISRQKFRCVENTCSNTKVARFSQNLRIILSYPLADLFEYLLMFWLHRNLPAKRAQYSKQSAKGYERIIQEILRGSVYFST